MPTSGGWSNSLRKNIFGGSLGNVLEWYDFAVYGYFAPIIATQFFPEKDKLAGLIATFGVFAIGYLVRPIGGILFGNIGDKYGRKRALQLSVLLMAIPTTLVGLLPTHAQVGVAASFLLVLLRLLQGMSVGGEFIGSISFITEIAPPHRRGFFGSWTTFSTIGGVMLGSAIAALAHGVFSDSFLHSWGWRIPFLAGCLIGGFALWMRRGLDESPEFEKLKADGQVRKNPFKEAITEQPAAMLHVMALVMLMGAGFYTLFVWWPTYLTTIVSPVVPHALTANTISMAVMMILIPFAGLWADKVGLKKILLLSLGGFIVLTWPLFRFADYGVFGLALGAQLVFAVMMSKVQAAIPATMVGMFPPRTRYSGIGAGYNLSMALFGGTAPLVCTWLIKQTGDILAPAWYLILMAVISFVATVRLKQPVE